MRHPKPDRPKAFTLVELVIVLAMLALAAGLALVGVQRLHDSHRHDQCANNLKQIGIAIHAYVDVYKKVPPAWNPDAGRPVSGPQWAVETGAGWCNSSPPPTGMAAGPNILGTIQFIILPFIEQDPLYKSSCPNGNNTNPFIGTTLATTVIPLYVCPADPSLHDNHQEVGQSGIAGGLASCNYAANLMVFDPKGTGNIIQAMPDGSSNTIMWTERARKCATNNECHLFAEPAWGNYPGYSGPGQGRTSYVAPIKKAFLYDVPVFGVNEYFLEQTTAAHGSPYAGGTNFTGYAGSTSCATTATVRESGGIAWGLNSTAGSPVGFQIGLSTNGDPCNANYVQASHPIGIQVLLGDGSVRSVTSAVSTLTWLYACLPNDGMPLGSDY